MKLKRLYQNAEGSPQSQQCGDKAARSPLRNRDLKCSPGPDNFDLDVVELRDKKIQ